MFQSNEAEVKWEAGLFVELRVLSTHLVHTETFCPEVSPSGPALLVYLHLYVYCKYPLVSGASWELSVMSHVVYSNSLPLLVYLS